MWHLLQNKLNFKTQHTQHLYLVEVAGLRYPLGVWIKSSMSNRDYCGCVCVCSCVWVHVHMWMDIWMPAEAGIKVLSAYTLCLSHWERISLNLELTDSVRLAGRPAPRILCLPPWKCCYRHLLLSFDLFFNVGMRYELRTSCLFWALCEWNHLPSLLPFHSHIPKPIFYTYCYFYLSWLLYLK